MTHLYVVRELDLGLSYHFRLENVRNNENIY